MYKSLQQLLVTFFFRLQRAEELYRREKEVHEAALASHTAEATELEERLLICRDTTSEEGRVATASRRVADARARRSMLKDDHARKHKEILDGIMEVVARSADHRWGFASGIRSPLFILFCREMVERKIGEIREMYSQRLESLLSQDQFSMSSSMFYSPGPIAASNDNAVNVKLNTSEAREKSTPDIGPSEDQNVESVNSSGYNLRNRNGSATKSVEKLTPSRLTRSSSKKSGSGRKILKESEAAVVANLNARINEAAAMK